MGCIIVKKSAIIASTVALTLLLGAQSVQAKSFKDISSKHWAKEQINFLVDREIIKGCSTDMFCDDKSISRAEAATMIMRYFGWNATGQENPGYPDLSESHWAYNDMVTLVELDIFKPEGKYEPNKPLTRGEMAQILVKTFELNSIKASTFKDVTREDKAFKEIQILASNGISSGYSDGTFRPDANVTRAEFAVFMSRAMNEAFKLEDKGIDAEGTIYDLRLNGQYIRLDQPLVLRSGWYAPIELFERLGYAVQELTSRSFTLTSVAGATIQLEDGSDTIWIGDTSAKVNEPVIFVNGQPYIKAHEVLQALEQKLTFYPNDFLIAVEAPTITNATIVKDAPQVAVASVHGKLPYWNWTKQDEDYMSLVQQGKKKVSEQKIREELNELMKEYKSVLSEGKEIRDITYYSTFTTGKLDVISRALEARYMHLYEPKAYEYPAMNKSSDTSLNSPYHRSIYTVQDYNYSDLIEQDTKLQQTIATMSDLPVEALKGLKVFSLPFTITEDDGVTVNHYAGLASGTHRAYVVNGGIGTFLHEFGHNWDHKFGDHSQYLAIRDRSNYVPATNDWSNRVGENFAEDFASLYYPDSYFHKGLFGSMNKEQAAELQSFVDDNTVFSDSSLSFVALNGMDVVPDVIVTTDGSLNVTGRDMHNPAISVEGISNAYSDMESFNGDGSFTHRYQLNEKGVYLVNVLGIQTIVIYQ